MEIKSSIPIFSPPSDELFMRRAFDLAQLGMGSVAPNPLVGCVIVHEGRIIGEGWHQRYGEAHAEVNAIKSIEAPSLLSQATAYVCLEPCSHFGKTPPCADLLVQHGLKRVVVANTDPNPLVAGKGIARLRQAGIEVTVGVLASEGQILNRRFFTQMEQQRPYIVLKWAQSADGFIALPNFEAVQISNAFSKQLVHKWRAEEDAIMIGTNTAFFDNPHLNVRAWVGRNPLRIVLDQHLRLPQSHFLFDNSQKTLIYNTHKNEVVGQNTYVCIDFTEPYFLTSIFQDLHARGVQSVLVEGGTQLLQSLITHRLWDEIRLFKSPKLLQAGIKAPVLEAVPHNAYHLANDELLIYYNEYTL